jgi:hypothetical protein
MKYPAYEPDSKHVGAEIPNKLMAEKVGALGCIDDVFTDVATLVQAKKLKVNNYIFIR